MAFAVSESYHEPGRITSFLRAFGNISNPKEVDDSVALTPIQEAELLNRRRALKIRDTNGSGAGSACSRFGSNIKFNMQPLIEKILESDPKFVQLTDTGGGGKEFSMENKLTFDLYKLQDLKHSKDVKKREAQVLKNDLQWFEKKLQDNYGATYPGKLSLQEFCLSIVQLLSLNRTSDDLQTDLFDLIGFDKFELIRYILEKRDEIVSAGARQKDQVSREIAASCIVREKQPERPNYGCQVIVQSESEKNLRRLVRKEEKRINKLKNKMEGSDEEDSDLDFDPVELRAKRQQALTEASLKPIFTPAAFDSTVIRTQDVPYPFVFDSLAKAKMAAGFIQGTKMSLPVGFQRKDDRKFEEITIPAASSSVTDIPKKLVPISDLDFIGRTAFEGMKNLNRIQSVVCDTAYRTNQNMLVCAPTGAGKTNVAMLCMLQTIRQHLDKDIIKKDAFKIVYVAPMKALAAEMTATFGKRLAPLGLTVRELTGDMQLTKTEIMQTQVLVTTPEKWDVVTRKPGDVSLAMLVRLLIIDEVHLLHGDRGPVVEALVARTLRLVESSQTCIRVVGLSATLPNYIDVAEFLSVNPWTGLFFFDSRFRPVPLTTTFIGVKSEKHQQMNDMDEICFEKALEFVRKGHQVMVFVHARNATVRTGLRLKELAQMKGHSDAFLPENSSTYGLSQKAMSKSRNKQLVELFNSGFACHHAGMLRGDRSLVEKLFSQGHIKVLVCTATLAWGVNLPAHAVIIKGTEIYDAKQGGFVHVGILDVLQIFGRAGRPQFDSSGHGTIITAHEKLSHYLSLLTNQFPIESNFIALIADNLNAEVSLGSVTTVDEAVRWLAYTYLFVRMRKNPMVYGIKYQEVRDDPLLEGKRSAIIVEAAMKLDKAQMIRYDQRTGYLHATDMGRTASHFYIKYDTVEIFNEGLRELMNECDILNILSRASEFDQLKVREDELLELDELTREYTEVPVAGGSENIHGKVNILIQTHISRGRVNSFSLQSDLNYVVTNATRIARALFEIVLRKNWPILAGRVLKVAIMIERQLWDFESPLRQHPQIKHELLNKLESRNFSIVTLRDMDSKEIGLLLRHTNAGSDVKRAAFEIPTMEVEVSVQPITRTVLRVRLILKPNFRWNDRIHMGSEPFYIWVEDPVNHHIYHHEYFTVTKKMVMQREPQELVFTIPIFEPLPSQYIIRAMSERWLGSEAYCPMDFKHLILPERHPPHTDLLDLQPLSTSALKDPIFEQLYSFKYFNPIQTQLFHTLYHTEKNVLLGAPTGSGKTIVAEIAMMAVFRDYPDGKVVYIAPLKALVSERIGDWKERIQKLIGKEVVELTGDVTPDVGAIQRASVIVTTPEKWDGISRSWQTRQYVQSVRLIVIDEIHLLGQDRGPVLEVIVSRTNFISSHTTNKLRIIGLSTAVANARDLADWLGIKADGGGLFNFKAAVRPVPVEVHISGFAGKHYCPRMATMNKPAFQAIQEYSPEKPSLIFVSSRRQTRLTALDLISFLAGENNPKMWLKMVESDLEHIEIKDQHLKLTLAFGIGMHHAGLIERDRKIVEELFVNRKIQVLIATATVAWGVNFPAHLVIVKGTEYFDGRQKRYVDMPITDVLQMIGRAGRPQFDDIGIACVFVQDSKKSFYKKFLYEPFPVESSLHQVLPDHLNAEIVAGTIQTTQEALDYMTWTYFFRRILQNPSYYQLEGVEASNVNIFLTSIVTNALMTLESSSCLAFEEEGKELYSTTLGRIASYYYLSHETVKHFSETLSSNMMIQDLLQVLCDSKEYDELPVRHNEDILNRELSKDCPIEVPDSMMDSSNIKAHLLLQAHFGHLPLPCSDYNTDTKSVLDQAIRILQAMIDVSAEAGWLSTTLQIQILLQMIIQGCWHYQSSVLTLPHLQPFMMYLFKKAKIDCLPALMSHVKGKYEVLASLIRPEVDESQIENIFNVLTKLPRVEVSLGLTTAAGEILPFKSATGPNDKPKWVTVKLDEEYILNIDLVKKVPKTQSKSKDFGKAVTSRFPKPKDEGWFLVLGNVDDNQDLLALKRVPTLKPGSSNRHQLSFFTPVKPGRLILTLYLMSDAYLGLDQQYDIPLEVCDAGPSIKLV